MVDGATGEVRATAFECEDALHPGVISRHSTEDPERSRENIEIIRQREREGGSWGSTRRDLQHPASGSRCPRAPTDLRSVAAQPIRRQGDHIKTRLRGMREC